MTAQHRAARRTLREVIAAWIDSLTNYSYLPTSPPMIGGAFAPWPDSPSQPAAPAPLASATTGSGQTTPAAPSDGR